jgi:hypothetical protein
MTIKFECIKCNKSNVFGSIDEFAKSDRACSVCKSDLPYDSAIIPTELARNDETSADFISLDSDLKALQDSLNTYSSLTDTKSGFKVHVPNESLKGSASAVASSNYDNPKGAASLGNDAIERLQGNTQFQTTIQVTQVPDFANFSDHDWFAKHRIEVLAEVPIESPSTDEITITLLIKTQLNGQKVAVWLRRGNVDGPGRGRYLYTTGSACRVSLKLAPEDREYELCIQPQNARNWNWCITVPVLRRSDVVHIKREYTLNQPMQVNGDHNTILGGYTYNNVTIADNAPPEATSRQLSLILDPRPRKIRNNPNSVSPQFCLRRNRIACQYTIRFGNSFWHLHGGTTLTFGKDKPLPDRKNQNDIAFRPHSAEKIWSQVSRTHGTFTAKDTKIHYSHSELGDNKNKKIIAHFPNGSMQSVEQPNEFCIPDAGQKFQFRPVLSPPSIPSQYLEVQGWLNRVVDPAQYVSNPNELGDSVGNQSNQQLGGFCVNVASENSVILETHFAISKSLTIGSSPFAQIQIQEVGIEPLHAFIHWLDGLLWIEPNNCQCLVKINGETICYDHLHPLTSNDTILLGASTCFEILHFNQKPT